MCSNAFEKRIAGCGVVGGIYDRLFRLMCGIAPVLIVRRSPRGIITNLARVFEGTCHFCGQGVSLSSYLQLMFFVVCALDLSHLMRVISYDAAAQILISVISGQLVVKQNPRLSHIRLLEAEDQ